MKWLTWSPHIAFLFLFVLGSAQAQPQGGEIFQQNCAVCHGPNGEGSLHIALAGNASLSDDTHVTGQILFGGQAMPSFGNVLSDDQIAAVSTFIRTSWNNAYGPISTEQVSDRRAGGTGAPEESEQAQAGEPATEQPAAQNEVASQPVTIDVSSGETPQLVDGSGQTLYRFVNDAPAGVSHCYEPCTTRWLPVISNTTTPGADLPASSLGTVEREDGTSQVTYRGWPLYRFVDDAEPGDAKGAELSDVWTVVNLDIEQLTPTKTPQ